MHNSNKNIQPLLQQRIADAPNIKLLIVTYSQLSQMPVRLLANASALIKIDFSFNQISSLEGVDFSKMPRLKLIMLQSNLFQKFQAVKALLGCQSAVRIDLKDNPFIVRISSIRHTLINRLENLLVFNQDFVRVSQRCPFLTNHVQRIVKHQFRQPEGVSKQKQFLQVLHRELKYIQITFRNNDPFQILKKLLRNLIRKNKHQANAIHKLKMLKLLKLFKDFTLRVQTYALRNLIFYSQRTAKISSLLKRKQTIETKAASRIINLFKTFQVLSRSVKKQQSKMIVLLGKDVPKILRLINILRLKTAKLNQFTGVKVLRRQLRGSRLTTSSLQGQRWSIREQGMISKRLICKTKSKGYLHRNNYRFYKQCKKDFKYHQNYYSVFTLRLQSLIQYVRILFAVAVQGPAHISYVTYSLFRRQQAALTIQTYFRSHLQRGRRKKLAEQMGRIRSVTKIQSCWRMSKYYHRQNCFKLFKTIRRSKKMYLSMQSYLALSFIQSKLQKSIKFKEQTLDIIGSHSQVSLKECTKRAGLPVRCMSFKQIQDLFMLIHKFAQVQIVRLGVTQYLRIQADREQTLGQMLIIFAIKTYSFRERKFLRFVYQEQFNQLRNRFGLQHNAISTVKDTPIITIQPKSELGFSREEIELEVHYWVSNKKIRSKLLIYIVDALMNKKVQFVNKKIKKLPTLSVRTVVPLIHSQTIQPLPVTTQLSTLPCCQEMQQLHTIPVPATNRFVPRLAKARPKRQKQRQKRVISLQYSVSAQQREHVQAKRKVQREDEQVQRRVQKAVQQLPRLRIQ